MERSLKELNDNGDGSRARTVVAFNDWTSSRKLFSVGTNHGSDELAYQGWQKFKEAFAPELIERAISSATVPVKRVIDPFGGSGTTALAAQFLGALPVTAEVNPYLADLIEAKLVTYDLAALEKDVEQFAYEVSSLSHAALDHGRRPPLVDYLPPTFVEPGVGGRWIFSKDVFALVSAALSSADRASRPDHRRLLKVVVGGCLIGLSNVRISGKGRRYRSNWSAKEKQAPDAAAAIVLAARGALSDIAGYNIRAEPGYELLRGDSRQVLRDVAPVELAIFSPPYPNSFDYTDVYNVELWVLGYLKDMEANRALRLATLSSHVQVKRSFGQGPQESPTLARALSNLQSVASNLWSPHLQAMIGGYFADMANVISQTSDLMVSKAQMWMVVGDSRYAGVDIPVATVLEELAASFGLAHVSSEPFRSMRTSPQQGGTEELAETLIVLEKG